LLTTSADRSGTVPVELVQVAPNPAQILANFKPDGRAHVVAARLTGPLKSAFTEAPKPSDDKEPAKDAPVLPPHIAATNGAANLIVIADSDLMGDRFWVRIADFFGDQTAVPFADNGAFVSNLTGTLAGGDALLGLRSRGVSARPFDYIDHMTQDADARYRQTAEGLTKHLEDLQKQLTSLRGTVQGASQTVLSPAQTAAIEDARKDVLETRKQLRAVQLDLRRDIAYVEGWLKIINIALVPAILAIVVILLALAQARRRARARS